MDAMTARDQHHLHGIVLVEVVGPVLVQRSPTEGDREIDDGGVEAPRDLLQCVDAAVHLCLKHFHHERIKQVDRQ